MLANLRGVFGAIGAVLDLLVQLPTDLLLSQQPFALILVLTVIPVLLRRWGLAVFTLQLPLALPTIMAGINQVIMLSLSMVVVAGLAGAPGLGVVIVQSVSKLDVGQGIEGAVAVVVLAIYLDRVSGALGTPRRRLRRKPRTPDATPAAGNESESVIATATAGAR